MKTYRKEHLDLASRIYELDGEVYQLLGSGLGRVYNGNRETTIRELAGIMEDVTKGHFLRSEMALIGNMARTIKDRGERARIMSLYNEILKQIEEMPSSFADSSSNTLMNSPPMIFLFFSGSSTPARRSRKRSVAST